MGGNSQKVAIWNFLAKLPVPTLHGGLPSTEVQNLHPSGHGAPSPGGRDGWWNQPPTLCRWQWRSSQRRGVGGFFLELWCHKLLVWRCIKRKLSKKTNGQKDVVSTCCFFFDLVSTLSARSLPRYFRGMICDGSPGPKRAFSLAEVCGTSRIW